MLVKGKLSPIDILNKLSGHCKDCNQKQQFSIQWRGRGTAYVDGRLNYTHVCKQCFESEEEYWEEMWNNYYAGLT